MTMKTIVVKEHEDIVNQNFPFLNLKNEDKYIWLLPNENGEDRIYFAFDINKKLYSASYVIGAQWVLNIPLVVIPKFEEIDFLKMFNYCLIGGITSQRFSEIYDIDLNSEKIQTNVFHTNILSPLIIVHFLSVVRKIISKGLKKGYISKEDNIRTVKGRLNVLVNDRKNIQDKRYDKFVCQFQEYTINIPENRIIKRALLFSKQVICSMDPHSKYIELNHVLTQCLTAFREVDENIQIFAIKNTKVNKLYQDYSDAVRIAKLILRRYDYNIFNTDKDLDKQEVPPFWIDMPLLYEQYVLGKLKEKYGDDILYQESGHIGKPDFLCKKINEKMILDTKYKDSDRNFAWDNIQQLSGYGRDNSLRKKLSVGDNECVKCVLIYPAKKQTDEDNTIEIPVFNGELSIADLLSDNSSKSLYYKEFYRISISLPQRIKDNTIST